jgi:hypothetical protein
MMGENVPGTFLFRIIYILQQAKAKAGCVTTAASVRVQLRAEVAFESLSPALQH